MKNTLNAFLLSAVIIAIPTLAVKLGRDAGIKPEAAEPVWRARSLSGPDRDLLWFPIGRTESNKFYEVQSHGKTVIAFGEIALKFTIDNLLKNNGFFAQTNFSAQTNFWEVTEIGNGVQIKLSVPETNAPSENQFHTMP